MKINLNDYIKVKLTDLGKDIYYHRYDEFNKLYGIYGREVLKPIFPEEDENGCTKFQLWEFMDLYGEYIGIGKPLVIYPFNIIYEESLTKLKNGKWIHDGHHIICDKCGTTMCDKDREGDTIPKKYCPNCGAKMEGEG